MGLFYKTMIREIRKKFQQSGEVDLEQFLKRNEEELKKEWNLGDLLFYLNISKLLEEERIESSYFKERNKDYENYI